MPSKQARSAQQVCKHSHCLKNDIFRSLLNYRAHSHLSTGEQFSIAVSCQHELLLPVSRLKQEALAKGEKLSDDAIKFEILDAGSSSALPIVTDIQNHISSKKADTSPQSDSAVSPHSTSIELQPYIGALYRIFGSRTASTIANRPSLLRQIRTSTLTSNTNKAIAKNHPRHSYRHSNHGRRARFRTEPVSCTFQLPRLLRSRQKCKYLNRIHQNSRE